MQEGLRISSVTGHLGYELNLTSLDNYCRTLSYIHVHLYWRASHGAPGSVTPNFGRYRILNQYLKRSTQPPYTVKMSIASPKT